MADLKFSKRDLADNPSTRLPVCLVLDTSDSMQGERIEELNKGVKMFMDAISEDEILKYSSDIAIVTFGNKEFSEYTDVGEKNPVNGVKKIFDFDIVEKHQVPIFTAAPKGYTPMGEAVDTAIRMLSERKFIYKENGIEYYQPWMVLMTDGQPYDYYTANGASTENSAAQSRELISSNKLTIFGIGVGKDVSMEVLARFLPKSTKFPPLKLRELNFKEFFDWLTDSMHLIKESMPGDSVTLPQTTWAEIKI